MHEVLSKPNPKAPLPLSFSVIRIPFFLEPHYDESRPFIESNRDRLVKKNGVEKKAGKLKKGITI